MEGVTGRADGGFLDDVAGALAAAVRRWRGASAVLLVAALLGALIGAAGSDRSLWTTWTVATSFLAGAVLTGPTGARRWMAKLDAACVVGVAIATLAGSIAVMTSDLAAGAPVAVLGVAFLVGAGPRTPIAAACAIALAALALVPWAVKATTGLSPCASRPFSPEWVAVLALLVAARRRQWTILVACVVGLLVWRGEVWWVYLDLRGPRTRETYGFVWSLLSSGASVLVAVTVLTICGRAASSIRRADIDEAATRLVVRLRRDAWRTAVVAFLLGWALFFLPQHGPRQSHLLVAVAGMCCLAHCAEVGTPTLRSLAPCVVASALCVPLAAALWFPWAQTFQNSKDDVLVYVPDAAPVLIVPLVIGFAVSVARAERSRWWGLLPAAAVAAIYVANFHGEMWRGRSWMAKEVTWCVLASLLVHAVAVGSLSWRVVLALSPVASFLLIDGFYEVRSRDPMERHLQPSDLLASILAGPVAALLALGARRVRSMTALPEDHPSLELAAARRGFPEG